MTHPLAGVRVVELARILAGPWAGQILADLGAEVVKVESPQGDDTRTWGPPFVDHAGERAAAYYHACNRGKAGTVADFTDPADVARVKALIADADVVIENFKVGGLAKYGLDYASLAADNPRLVYCSITGFGQDGPYASRPGYDFIIQGMGGIMSLTGEPDGAPQKIGVAFADIMTGLYATIGIQAALLMRERTGRGQLVDCALLDTMTGVLANQAANYFASGVNPPRMGNAHANVSPYAVFPTADGWFILAVGNDAQYRRFAQIVGIAPDRALGNQRRPHRPPRAVVRARSRSAAAPSRGTTCSPGWRRRASPRARSTPSNRRSPTRRSRRAAWCCRPAIPARSRACAPRSASRTPQLSLDGGAPALGSTPLVPSPFASSEVEKPLPDATVSRLRSTRTE